MSRVAYGQKGYSGASMSINAAAAYDKLLARIAALNPEAGELDEEGMQPLRQAITSMR